MVHVCMLSVIFSCFKYDKVTEILKALEENGSKFALRTKAQMMQGSPTSLVISLENIRRGIYMTFLECLKMEVHVLSIMRVCVFIVLLVALLTCIFHPCIGPK